MSATGDGYALDRNGSNGSNGRVEEDKIRRGQVKRALVAGTVGTAIEWYDFFLYGTAAALVFPELFFPNSSEYAGTLAAFATYAVGFAARPVGAALFGHWGDRVGRKATLIATLLVMGIASFLIGCMPTYETLGVLAPTILVVLRLLQGLGVGGEWAGSVTLTMEWGDPKRRGLMGSLPQAGVAIGLLLSTGMVSLMTTLSGDAFATWGWRVPFLFSIVLIGIGLWIRLGVLESPMFAKEVEQKSVEKLPAVEVVKRHPKEILLSALLRMGEQMPFYIFTVFVLEYGTGDLGMSDSFMTNTVMAAAALSLFSIPFFGHLSDKIGRKRLYMAGAAIMGVWGFAYFGLLNTESSILIFVAVFLSLIPHDMQYGPQAALIAESFPTKLRYSGAGLGYQLSSVFAGGPAPLLATFLLHEFNSTLPIAVYIAVGSALGFVATWLLPEPGRQAVEKEFTSTVEECIPETAKRSAGKIAVTS